MTTNREDEALDALIASFYVVDPDDFVPLDDPAILTEEDRKAIDALGDDLVERLHAKLQEIEETGRAVWQYRKVAKDA